MREEIDHLLRPSMSFAFDFDDLVSFGVQARVPIQHAMPWIDDFISRIIFFEILDEYMKVEE